MIIRKTKRLSILFLAIFALAALRAEAQVLTLIPTEALSTSDMTISADDQGKPLGLVALNFQTNSIPADATITGASLAMYCEKTHSSQYQTITVYEVPVGERLTQDDINALQGEKSVPEAYTTLWPNDLDYKTIEFKPKGDLRESLAKWPKHSPAEAPKLDYKKRLPTGLTLLLRTEGGDGRKWYSEKAQDSRLRPRLILEYATKNQPAVAQPVSVRSTRSFLPPQKPNPQTSYDVRDVQIRGPWSNAPAFHGGFVYLMTDENSNKTLSWRNPLGVIAGTPIPLTELDPGQHLLVSELGYLYIVGNKKIIPYRIGADGTPVLRTHMTKVDNEVGLNPDALHAPTLGADGSIFYVSGSVKEGWTVVARNPDLQELWKVPVGKLEPSRVTLGPSGQYVYVISAHQGLVTIDARTGEKFVKKLSNQQADKTLQAPVVIRNKDGIEKNKDGFEKVYVAAHSSDSGTLELFDNGRTKTRTNADDDNGIWTEEIAAATIDERKDWKSLEGLVGQPLVSTFDTTRIYIVRVKDGKATLASFDSQDGSPKNESAEFTVGRDDPYLLNGGNLATDKDGNIFFWNGDVETYFRGFTPTLDPLFPETTINDLQSNSNLFFGTDGSLYVGAIGAKADLRLILPKYTLDTNPSATNSYSITLSSPTHLRVNGIVDKPTTLSAPGSVFLGNGFTVEQGATFTVKRP